MAFECCLAGGWPPMMICSAAAAVLQARFWRRTRRPAISSLRCCAPSGPRCDVQTSWLRHRGQNVWRITPTLHPPACLGNKFLTNDLKSST